MLKPASTAVLICIATVTAAEAQSLAGKALTEAVAGSLVEIDTPLGTKLPIHYSENGRMSGDAKDLASYLGAAADTGRWWVEDDQLCHKWLKWFKTEPQCLRIEKRGSKVSWRAQDGTTGTATIVSRMETVAASSAPAPKVEEPRSPAARIASSVVVASAAPRPEKLEPPMRLTPPAALEEPKAASPPPKPAAGKPAASAKRPAVVVSASGSGLVSRSAAAASVMPAAKPAPALSAPEPKGLGASVGAAAPAYQLERSASEPRYKVANVDSDDVLNMRYGPSAETAAVGAIPHDGRGIEVTGDCQSGWCPVRHRNVEGWVRRSFLASEQAARDIMQSGAFTRGYVASARRDSADAPRSCLTASARTLLGQIEGKFGPMRLVSTCRAGATIAGSGRPSKHASGNAIDFEAGSRKHEVVEWLIAHHQTGGTMTYADMDHIHVDIGPHFVSLGAPSGQGGGRYSRRWSRWANNG